MDLNVWCLVNAKQLFFLLTILIYVASDPVIFFIDAELSYNQPLPHSYTPQILAPNFWRMTPAAAWFAPHNQYFLNLFLAKTNLVSMNGEEDSYEEFRHDRDDSDDATSDDEL